MNKTPTSFQDSSQEAEEYYNTAYRFLIKHDIPPTPANYTVAYEYAARRHAPLNEEIERQIGRGATLDSYFLSGLYERFFLSENADNLENHVTDIHAILYQALHGLTSATDDFKGYEELLEQQIEQLTSQPEMSSYKIIAAKLLQGTQQTLDNSTRLRTHLEESNHKISSLQQELEEVRQEAYTDGLTGLSNRKALTDRLDQLLEEQTQNSNPLSVLMLDIDHFKKFNDTYGHLIGDEVIRRVASTLMQYTDEDSMAARYGGEEFTLIMPNVAIEHALDVARAIHAAVANLVLVRRKTKERLPGITISVGAASMKQGEGRDDLLERADQALYMAKNNGRNQIYSELQLAAAS